MATDGILKILLDMLLKRFRRTVVADGILKMLREQDVSAAIRAHGTLKMGQRARVESELASAIAASRDPVFLRNAIDFAFHVGMLSCAMQEAMSVISRSIQDREVLEWVVRHLRKYPEKSE